MRNYIAPILAVSLSAGTAGAYDLGNGFSTSGSIELEYLKFDNDNGLFLNSDSRLSWRGSNAGQLGFGFDLNLDGLSKLDKPTGDASNLWVSAMLEFRGIALHVGAPEPATRAVIDFPAVSTAKLVDAQLEPFRGQLATAIARENSDLAPGVAVTGGSGELAYAVSWHRMDMFDIPDTKVEVTEAALSWRTGATTLFGSAAHANEQHSSDNINNVQIGALYDGGALSLGAIAGRNTGLLASNFGQLNATYRLSDAFALRGNVAMVNPKHGANVDIWALGADFKFANGAYVEGGYSSVDKDDVWDVGLGFRF